MSKSAPAPMVNSAMLTSMQKAKESSSISSDSGSSMPTMEGSNPPIFEGGIKKPLMSTQSNIDSVAKTPGMDDQLLAGINGNGEGGPFGASIINQAFSGNMGPTKDLNEAILQDTQFMGDTSATGLTAPTNLNVGKGVGVGSSKGG